MRKMRKEIENLLVEKNKLREDLRLWVKDKSIPLEERWDVFLLSELGTHSVYCTSFKWFDTDDYCEYTDRYQTINMEYVEELYLSHLTEEQLAEFKEDVLEHFIKSFEIDW